MKTPAHTASCITLALEKLRTGGLRATIRNDGHTVAYFEGKQAEARQLVATALNAGASQHAIGDGYDFTFIRLNEAAQAAWDATPPAAQPAHTPTPWRVGDCGRTVYGPKTAEPSPVTIASSDSTRTTTAEKRANVALIVAAVNSHASLIAERDQLRAALENCITTPGALAERSHEYALRRLNTVTAEARAALALSAQEVAK